MKITKEGAILMIRFNNDYHYAAHACILDALALANDQDHPGYGEDVWCRKAADEIRKLTGREDAEVQFFTGATQANFVVISAALNAVQSVISPKSGHINQHEAGSVENTGHKILELETSDGKISAAQIRECAAEYYESGEPEHLTEPKLVYISFPTEFGSLYSKQELQEIHEVCRTYGMYLFIDGARLGYGLGSCVNDVTPQDLAAFADVFYFGGTKCGAMFGEAVVILNDRLKKRFRSYMKQNGAVLAKGWLLGFQFYMLLKDGAYFEITRQADAQAMRIKEAFAQKGILPYVESFTNQQFVIVTPQQEAKLAAKYIYEPSGSLPDGRSIIRFCTSWSTKEEDVDALIEDIRKL